MKNMRTIFQTCCAIFLLILFSLSMAFLHHDHAVRGQTSLPSAVGTFAPTPNGSGTAASTYLCNSSSRYATYWNTTSNSPSFCDGTNWNSLGGGGFQAQDFTLLNGLFSTNTALSTIYYEPNAVNIRRVVTREQGSPVCTAAPVLVLLDLGTSASTAYGSATVLVSQTLSTSNTVVDSVPVSVSIAAGHFLGAGFSAGTCVTPPTINVSVTLQ